MTRPILLSSALAAILVACGGGGGAKNSPTPEASSTPTVTAPVSQSGCSKESAKAAMAAISTVIPIASAFDDAVNRSQGVARITLAPLIADVQKARRDVQAVVFPDCAATTFQKHLIDGMNSAIDGMIQFQSGATQAIVDDRFAQFRQLVAEATGDEDRLSVDAGN